jgi:CheY-like chemotaxis protein
MDNRPRLLLCVDDDEDDIALTEEAALDFDSSLRFVAKPNGKEAMMFLHRQKEQNYLPCLVLLDINMPLMDGREVLEAMKNDPDLQKIPIVVFTTSSGQREKQFCESYSVEFVTKPNRVAEFKKVVAQLLVRCIV